LCEEERLRKIEMKEHPIIFSAPMVRAILEGRKTMTRRVLKPQPTDWVPDNIKQKLLIQYACPYGRPGDKLWVRETWATCGFVTVAYRADGKTPNWLNQWRPSIFMPRRLSRIALEMTSVRVEKLQEITEGDAINEGVYDKESFGIHWAATRAPIPTFKKLWDSINSKKYSWSSNPFVWVISFVRENV
jgi:hypothetical protein